MTNSRTKGRAGEQEVCRILRDELGIEVHRNWQEQAFHGGVDILGIEGWAIEVKRAKEYRNDWWIQAAQQGIKKAFRTKNPDEKAVLIYRLDRQDWKARMCLCAIHNYDIHGQVEMDLKTWISIVRESI